MLIFIQALFVQVLAAVPVTQYSVFALGDSVMDAQVVQLTFDDNH